MRVSRFTHDMLLLCAGPLVWAVHFLAIYGFTGLVCARPALAGVRWLGLGIVPWGVAGAGVAAAAALAACLFVQPRDPSPADRDFLRQLSIGLGLLAVLAIGWETASVFLAPACA